MRNKLIAFIYDLQERVDGFDYMFHRLNEMSNVELLELYVEMRIEEYDDLKMKGLDYGQPTSEDSGIS